MLYNVNASLQYKFLYLSNICVLHQSAGIGIFWGSSWIAQWWRRSKPPSPQRFQQRKGAGNNHDHQRTGFRWCWRSAKPSSRLYVSNIVHRKVGDPLQAWCTRRRTRQRGARWTIHLPKYGTQTTWAVGSSLTARTHQWTIGLCETHHPQWMAYPVSGNLFFQHFYLIFIDTSYNIYPCTCFPF